MALTEKGNRVLDPMCGSGTAIAVAVRLGREAIGFDTSDVAVATARARLHRLQTEGNIIEKGKNRCASS
jgi:DNA modification methylase